jgi:hypothetical protein
VEGGCVESCPGGGGGGRAPQKLSGKWAPRRFRRFSARRARLLLLEEIGKLRAAQNCLRLAEGFDLLVAR